MKIQLGKMPVLLLLFIFHYIAADDLKTFGLVLNKLIAESDYNLGFISSMKETLEQEDTLRLYLDDFVLTLKDIIGILKSTALKLFEEKECGNEVNTEDAVIALGLTEKFIDLIDLTDLSKIPKDKIANYIKEYDNYACERNLESRKTKDKRYLKAIRKFKTNMFPTYKLRISLF